MVRTLPVCAVLLALAPAARTQEKAKPHEEVIRLTVHPAPAPKPALKYQLLPELREMNPGNPILGYLRCFSEQNRFFYGKEAEEQRRKWQEMPLKDLPVKEMRGYGGAALRQADYAARLDTPDWQLLPKLRTDGIALLAPDIQQMRMLAYTLQFRFRGEVADRRFDDALTTAQTMFALARHTGKYPTLIGNLVGIAFAHAGIGPLEALLQQPGCPNLFWALSDLPRPLIDLREGLQGERLMLASQFRLLNEKAPMGESELAKTVASLHELFHLIGPKRKENEGDRRDVRAWLDRRVKDEGQVRAARQRLVEFGLAEGTVNKFPPLQVVLLDQKYTFEELRDEVTRGLALPYWQAEAVLAQGAESLRARLRDRANEPLLGSLVPAVLKVRLAQARLEQRLALLRHVEALRLYAATHDGQLPKQLSDIKLPLPLDPVSGQPFHYALEGRTATLRGSPLSGMFTVRYVITLAK